MGTVDWVLLVLLWVVILLPAVPAVTRGRLPRGWRGRNDSPRLWGAGYLMLGFGATAAMTARHWDGPAWAVGGGLGLGGLALMAWSGRARRDGAAPQG